MQLDLETDFKTDKDINILEKEPIKLEIIENNDKEVDDYKLKRGTRISKIYKNIIIFNF